MIFPRSNDDGQFNCKKHQYCFKDPLKCRENINNKGKCDERINESCDIRYKDVSLMDICKISDSVGKEKPNSVKIDGFIEEYDRGGFD